MKRLILLLLIFNINHLFGQDFIKERKYQGDPLFDFVTEWWGVKYRYGGETKKGIDCSAFTLRLFDKVYNVIADIIDEHDGIITAEKTIAIFDDFLDREIDDDILKETIKKLILKIYNFHNNII